MSTEPIFSNITDPVIADQIKRYKAGRVIEFFVMQIGWESLEDAYEHYVVHEPYGLAALNAEFERLRLLVIEGGEPGSSSDL